MVAWADRFDLEKQLVFYMSYHDNSVNKYMHFLCIWPIIITSQIMLATLEPLAEQPAFLAELPYSEYLVLNPSAVAAAIYILWYIVLDIKAGTLGAALMFLVYVFANYFAQTAHETFGYPGWQLALVVNIVSYITQFVGHGVFERRKPALFDSLDQAFITAPLFVLLEILFPLGYRPELYKRVMKQAKLNVAAFHKLGKTL